MQTNISNHLLVLASPGPLRLCGERIGTNLLFVLMIIFVSAEGFSQTSLKELPGYERYQQIRKNRHQLIVGGKIVDLRWSDDGRSFTFERLDKHYRFNLDTQNMQEIDEPAEQDQQEPDRRRHPARGRQMKKVDSPDDRYTAESREWNLWLIDNETGQEQQITTDGSRKFRYATASWVYGEELRQQEAMWWSSDSTMIAFYEFDERHVRDFELATGLTDVHSEIKIEGYPKAGDPNPIANLLVYHLESEKRTRIDVGDDDNQYIFNVRFSPDGSELLYFRTNRQQNVLEFLAADPHTGESRVVFTETQPSWQHNRPEMQFIDDGHRFIWSTEESGWKHYEVRDLNSPEVISLTSGQYPVEQIVYIDEDAGILYYTAYSDSSPLNAQVHRVRLEGCCQLRLTTESVHHTNVRFSPDGRWFIATTQTIESPPQTSLFTREGERVAVLAEPDMSKFEQLGLREPQQFQFTAADDQTTLYGILYKPSNFDPEKTYPLLIDVYGGPLSGVIRNRWRGVKAVSEFGFLIAKLDNRGTSGRGKAFEDAAYKKLGIVDLDDQVAGVKYLAKRDYVDGQRVGIYGHSYGGYMSAMAILRYPEVYSAAAAMSAVTDWRNYDTIYTERFMGLPQQNEQAYDKGSAIEYADQLEGDLLLMHGMADDNVHPNNAWQLAKALQEAGKPFEMMFFPESAHGIGGRYARNLLWTFFYRHLIGE